MSMTTNKSTPSEMVIQVPISLLKVAAKEQSRYAISGVLIRRRGADVIGVATNGRALAVRVLDTEGKWPPSIGDHGIANEFIIHRDSLRIGNVRGTTTLAVCRSGVFVRHKMGVDIPAVLVDGTFPPFDSVIPDADKFGLCIATRTDVLSPAMEAAGNDKDGYGSAIMFSSEGAEKMPVGVVSSDGRGIAVAMPTVTNPDFRGLWTSIRKIAKGEKK